MSREPENMECNEERSLDEVRRIMNYAKLEESEHLPRIQSVYFSPDMDPDTYKFIEINKQVLKTLEEGDKVVIRGDTSDSAVLCTTSETFDIKEQETSNGLLLLPELNLPADISKDSETHVVPRQVLCLNYKYYELREMQPRLKKLQNLLEENVFSGLECEEDEDHINKKYTHSDLLGIVQASEEEIDAHLVKLEACKINGHWRLLDAEFKGKVLEHVLSLREENAWSWQHVPLDTCCTTLADIYDKSIVENVLKSFSDIPDEALDTANQTGQEFSLSEDKICRYYAESILKAVNQMNLKEFENVWQMSTPDGLQSSMYQLEGIALIDRDSLPEVIKYFPESQLPETPPERFNYLFRVREKWTADEIMPYIKELATEKLSASALLTKFARASNQNGVKVYNSKRPVT